MTVFEKLVLFPRDSESREDPFSRVLFFSVLIHYAVFYLLIGNPFLLLLGDKSNRLNLEKHFNVQLLSLPKGENPSQKALLGLFPPEVGGEENSKPENLDVAGAVAAHGQDEENSDPGRMPDMQRLNSEKNGGEERIGPPVPKREDHRAQADFPVPLVSSKRLPGNMTGPEDCMIKVVGMVCPNGDVACITEYKAFCATLPN